MIIFKIIPICITSLILILFLKNTSSQFAIIVSIVAGIMIIMYITPYIDDLITDFSSFSSGVECLKDVFSKIIKVVIVAIICEIASQLCLDVGEKFLANQVCFAGKVAIIGIISTDIILFISYLIELIKCL